MIKQLAHVCIHARDLDATRRFYCDTLGAEVGFDFQRDGRGFGYYLKLGASTFIEVFEGEPGGEGNIRHLALEVDDIQAVVTALREHGAEASDPQFGDDHAWQAWTTDPNGVRIELHQYTEKSMQLVGGVCKVTW